MAPSLVFSFTDPPQTECFKNPNHALIVDKTLTQCRQLKLKKFQVDIFYDIRFESQYNNWIRFGINRNAEELYLGFWYDGMNEAEFQFALDQSLFVNSCITDLRLYGCMVNPIGAISWKSLRYLCIYEICINEDLIENILSGSPVLETLMLDNCYGYRRIDISSKSVKNLVFSEYWNPYDKFKSEAKDIIEINAPNILSLTIQQNMFLKKLLLLNVSSLVKADLNYTCISRIPRVEAKEEMLKEYIMNLGHVKELKIGNLCYESVSRLQAKGFVFPSNVKFHGVRFEKRLHD